MERKLRNSVSLKWSSIRCTTNWKKKLYQENDSDTVKTIFDELTFKDQCNDFKPYNGVNIAYCKLQRVRIRRSWSVECISCLLHEELQVPSDWKLVYDDYTEFTASIHQQNTNIWLSISLKVSYTKHVSSAKYDIAFSSSLSRDGPSWFKFLTSIRWRRA